MNFGLPQSAIRKIYAILSRHPQVEQAILYGSRAKGDYKNGSDIDLALRGGTDLTLTTIYRIIAELDDSSLPYTVDLCIFNDISSPDLIGHIQRVGVTFYKKDEPVPELVDISR